MKSAIFLIFLNVLLALQGRAGEMAPHIFHLTETGLAGDVIGIQGDQFHHPEVWMDRIEGSNDPPNPEIELSQVLSASNKNISVLLPEDFQPGLCAIFVKSRGLFSPPAWLNRAEVWQALDLAGLAIDPGREFRLAGRNLNLPGAASAVRFVSAKTSESFPATVHPDGGQFLLKVTAPDSLIAGESYELLVTNGHGGVSGEVRGPKLEAVRGGADPFRLNIPWAGEFDFADNIYNVKTDPRLGNHAVGDGAADDSAAIQEAIDKANAAGGGVVFFPEGKYNVAGNNIIMRSHVVLKGAGRERSVIWDNQGFKRPKSRVSMFMSANREWWKPGAGERMGVADLTIACGPQGFKTTWKVGGNGPSFFVRSRIVNPNKAVLEYGTHRMLVDDCEIVHSPPDRKNVISWPEKRDVLLRNSYIEWADGRLYLPKMRRFQAENNKFMRSVKSDGRKLGYGGPSIGGSSQVAFLGNTFGKIGEGKLPYNNDGETILNENVTRIATGRATAGGPDRLEDARQKWKPDALNSRSVFIIQGKGMGQLRKISANTETAVTVAEPWTIPPGPSSYYTITELDEHYLIKDNLLQDVPRGIWLYSCSINKVAIVGNRLIDADKIWLRGDQRLRENRFNVQRNILLQDNELKNTRNWYGSQILIDQRQIDGKELMGTAFYNIVVRGNRVDAHQPNHRTVGDGAWGEGYFSHLSPKPGAMVDNDTPATLGVIFQRNTAIDTRHAYHLNTGSYQTIISEPVLKNVGNLLFNNTLEKRGGKHVAVGTVIGPFAE